MTTTKPDMKGPVTFTQGDGRIRELFERLHEIADLQALDALAQWDQQTAMPPGASEVRGHQLATIGGLIHERWVAPRLGALLDELQAVIEQEQFTSADRGLVRYVRRTYDRATKLPRELVEEMARVGNASVDAWTRARSQSDFAIFAPWLRRTVALQREVADRLGFEEMRYDALLDEYEPGLTTRKVETLFERVRTASIALLQRIQASGYTVDASCLHGNFPVPQQITLCEKALRGMGYDFTCGQLAQSAHPFTSSFGSPFDVRVTTRYNEHFLQQGLMASLHEGGHAVYEQGVSPALVRTIAGGGSSMGIHESQSRLWENCLARSLPYWQGQYALVKEFFPEQFANVNVQTFVRALNKVEPSMIRVEADEVTYNLHILIRFELEKALMNDDLAIESLPRLWNEKYREYLGIVPANEAEGVLQDIHWASGFGYFPSYTLGNLYAAQIFAALQRVFPDFETRLAQGDTSFVLHWLRENLYTYGAIYTPDELIQHVSGEPANPEYFVRYLLNKFSQVYNLPVEGL